MLIGRETPHGGDIYHHEIEYDFSANVNPLGTPPQVTEAICAAAAHVCAYPNPYCTELTEGLAKMEGVNPDWIICGNGAADLIFQFCLALKPKRALILAPTFSEYEQALKTVGCQVDYFVLQRQSGFQVTEEILERITGEAVFICNPNNPTGVLTDKGLLCRIAAECRNRGACLFLDECFNDFLEEPEKYTMKGQLGEYPNLFILKAFTKLYGMAGVRLGYGLCSSRGRLSAMCDVSQTWNVSALAQAAGRAALDCTEFVSRTKELIGRERRWLTEELSRLGIQVYPGTANYLMLRSELPLYEKLLERKILIRRCGNYRGLDEHDYRIAVKTHSENRILAEQLRQIVRREKC